MPVKKPDFIPYGPQWEKELMQMPKIDIIKKFLKPALTDQGGILNQSHEMGVHQGYCKGIEAAIKFFDDGWDIPDLPDLYKAAEKSYNDKYSPKPPIDNGK